MPRTTKRIEPIVYSRKGQAPLGIYSDGPANMMFFADGNTSSAQKNISSMMSSGRNALYNDMLNRLLNPTR